MIWPAGLLAFRPAGLPARLHSVNSRMKMFLNCRRLGGLFHWPSRLPP
jgi:hypothetical protein